MHIGYRTRSFYLTMSICRIIVFQFLITIGHSTEKCHVSENRRPLVNSLLRTLLRSLNVGDSTDPDPTALLALRLANLHNLTGEKQFQQRLIEAAIRKVKEGDDFSSGPTALYTLAFRSACLDPAKISDGHSQIDLVEHLNSKLKQEIQSLELNRQPLTDYYQLALAILALCIEKQPVSTYVVEELIVRIMDYGAPFITFFSIDTASMSVLALSCLHGSPFNKIKRLKIERPIVRLLQALLAEQQKDGIIGTIYSTGLAVQALIANQQLDFKIFHCSTSLERLISEIPKGTFDTLEKISHVVPALEGHTYLDVQSLHCTSDQDNLPQENEG
ncbi:cobalamin binding intrinsic factor-like isoform X2 [Scyliorhinus canicula]|uniref:cobalamin binding intrinsic factor-like isoform X2 n=1 Tax=Scyliorhinus canicula TaxID=7830 RepID=UPI0018F7625B|nr:cobalamin binding intrinsic factor-like isoform X2 [Scyliorhinus canicula]